MGSLAIALLWNYIQPMKLVLWGIRRIEVDSTTQKTVRNAHYHLIASWNQMMCSDLNFGLKHRLKVGISFARESRCSPGINKWTEPGVESIKEVTIMHRKLLR
jgi:hypothetical protein